MSDARGARGAAREWFSAGEIVAAQSPDLPGTIQAFNRMAVAQGWRADPAKARPAAGRGRENWKYHISLLPPGAQARLALAHVDVADDTPAGHADLWARFEGLSKRQKETCEARLAVLHEVAAMEAAGSTASAAAAMAARKHDVSIRSIFGWRKMVAGVPRSDWLAALAPEWKATADFAECHPKAWDIITSDWLRPSRPSFSSCYRRMRREASAHGWLPIPSERALRRRVEKEIPRGVITLARDGKDKARTLIPAQRRTRAGLTAMEAVNMDGHKLDVFVSLPGRAKPTRVHLLALQDLHSGKIVAWRLSETENKETVRLVIGDMVEAFGIPDKIVLDNGPAFASKWISGGSPTRYRFKVRDEDPQGLLTTLGVEIIWARPYAGQSKPIERAFRDLADSIAKHPFCAGAYTGNRPEAKPEDYATRAVAYDAFRAHVAAQIAEHNARPGRRSETCAGRSFDETFEHSLAQPTTIVRQATAQQKALWLLAAEQVTAQRGSGEIRLFGNRYWSAELNALAGSKVTVRFDPENLHQPLRVYDRDERLICMAACIADTGFFDAQGAREQARDVASFLKAQRDHERLREKLSADELARIYGAQAETPERPRRDTKVTRLAVKGGARPAPAPAPEEDFDFEAAFSRGLRLIASNE